VAGPLAAKQVLPNRLAIEARQPVDLCDRKALSTKGAKIIHVPASQQLGYLLLAGVLVTQIQSEWGFGRSGEFYSGPLGSLVTRAR